MIGRPLPSEERQAPRVKSNWPPTPCHGRGVKVKNLILECNLTDHRTFQVLNPHICFSSFFKRQYFPRLQLLFMYILFYSTQFKYFVCFLISRKCREAHTNSLIVAKVCLKTDIKNFRQMVGNGFHSIKFIQELLFTGKGQSTIEQKECLWK